MVATETNLTIGSSKLVLPRELRDDMVEKVRARSVIASLCPQQPESFTDVEHIVFTKDPAAEWVGESDPKHLSDADWKYVQSVPHKAQVTVRVSNELEWKDEEAQGYIMRKLVDKMSMAMADMVDAGPLHAANPLDRTVVTSMKPEALSYAVPVANQVAATTDMQADLDALPDKVIGDYELTGVAFDRVYANAMRKMRNSKTGERVYPDLGMGLNMTNWEGINAVVSANVAGNRFLPAASPSGIKAIIGNWNLFNWGYVRQFGITPIRYGDPDGTGRDLQRYNEVAYRMEAVIAWIIFDPAGFAILRDASTVPTEPGKSDTTGKAASK
jgi:hypothetical protein